MSLKNFIHQELLTGEKVNTAKIKQNGHWIQTNHPDKYNLILQETSNLEEPSFSQRIFHITKEITDHPICPLCKSTKLKFLTFGRGYRETCECIRQTDRSNENTKEKFKKSINARNKKFELKMLDFLNECNTSRKLTEEQLKKLLVPYMLRKNNRFFTKNDLLKNHFFVFSELVKHTPTVKLGNIKSISDIEIPLRLFLFMSKLKNIPLCGCGSPRKFINSIIGFQDTCSRTCGYKTSSSNKIFTVGRKIKNVLSKEFLIVSEYNGRKDNVKIIHKSCKKEFHKIFHNGIYTARNLLCPYCEKSSMETEILEFLENNNLAYIHNDRMLLGGKELDFLLDDYGFAIEFNGLYWHSENSGGKYRKYHLEKTEQCEAVNMRLFHIFENEWKSKKNIWKSMILSRANMSEKIYARKCTIKEISSKLSNSFLEENHLQGKVYSSVCLGLYYIGELVSVMTFGKSRYDKSIQWELHRFSSKLNTTVVGGASKLLKYFEKKNKPTTLLSYADRRYSNGNLYKKLEFEFVRNSPPSYHYVTRDGLLGRQNFQKHKLKDKLNTFDPNLTEWENMKLNGYDRVWDCGNMVFVKTYPENY